MKRILHLTSSIQGENSYSVKLGNKIIEKIMSKYPESTVLTVDLNTINLPHLNPELIHAMFNPFDSLSEKEKSLLSYSNEAIDQLLNNDIIVIGAPLYNFTIPSTLKAWIDHITRAGITFGYSDEGRPIGLVKGKKVYVAMTAGGLYTEGPGVAFDFVGPYLKAFLGFLGMNDLTVITADGLKVPGYQENAMENAYQKIEIE